jgi:hypothetical protein
LLPPRRCIQKIRGITHSQGRLRIEPRHSHPPENATRLYTFALASLQACARGRNVQAEAAKVIRLQFAIAA